MARRVSQEEGILIGGSGGTAVAAALRVAERAGPDDLVVVLIPDSGRGYLSRVFNDDWMANYGFLTECDLCVGNVLSSRGDEVPPLVYVNPDERVRDAIAKHAPPRRLAAAGVQERPALRRGRGRRRGRRARGDGRRLPRPGRDGRGRREGDGPQAADHRHRPTPDARRRDARTGTGAAGAVRRTAAERALPHRRPLVPYRRRMADQDDEERQGPGFATRAIHAGQEPDPATGAVVVPITLATTFAQAAVGEHLGFEYSRSGNPTARRARSGGRIARERRRTAWPSPRAWPPRTPSCASSTPATAWCSATTPTAARSASSPRSTGRPAWRGRRPTSPTSTPSPPAGPTAPAWCGWRRRPTRCSRASTSRPSPSWPTTRAPSAWSTTPSPRPFLQNPLDWGADVVVHSATKYLGGHSDVVGGFVALDDDELAERLRFTQNAAGAVPAPFDCYLVLRGLKTLAVRMERHCENARAVVDAARGPPRGRPRAVPDAARPPGPLTRRRSRCATTAAW